MSAEYTPDCHGEYQSICPRLPLEFPESPRTFIQLSENIATKPPRPYACDALGRSLLPDDAGWSRFRRMHMRICGEYLHSWVGLRWIPDVLGPLFLLLLAHVDQSCLMCPDGIMSPLL
jgi:hypothetical protein